jgi:hypothetical protein
MHRSGTSAMAGVLSILGANFNFELIKKVVNDNPKGYWESVEVVDINNDIFHIYNMHYMDFSSFPNNWMENEMLIPIRQRIKNWFIKYLSKESLIVVKDPRLCRTLPIWVDTLQELNIKPKYIHIFRHPMEVVASLRTRDNTFSMVNGFLVWIAHLLDSFECTTPNNSIIISYNKLLNAPFLTLKQCSNILELEWPLQVETVSDKINMFLDPSLIHHCHEEKISMPPLNNLLQSIFNSLKNYELTSPNKEFYSLIETFQINFKEYKDLFSEFHINYLHNLNAEKINAKEQIEYRDALIAEITKQLDAEKINAKNQIEYRDALIAEITKQLDAEKINAKNQIEYRDALIAKISKQI